MFYFIIFGGLSRVISVYLLGLTSFKQHFVFVTDQNKQQLLPMRKRKVTAWVKDYFLEIEMLFFFSFFHLPSISWNLDFVLFRAFSSDTELWDWNQAGEKKVSRGFFGISKAGRWWWVYYHHIRHITKLLSPTFLVTFQRGGIIYFTHRHTFSVVCKLE